ncbi:MAG: sigma-54-dependent Fis family transcriptional regulator, partial [Acidobacteriota bacterium]
QVKPARHRARLEEIADEQVRGALRAERFRIGDTATRLGISRAAVYKLIKRSSRVRQASELSRDEIAAASADCDGDLGRMVDRLEVSAAALRRRMRGLGFD